jgi:hypothetical protein
MRPMTSYAALCDDFGASSYLIGKVDMPTGRETVLHFFEAMQKQNPTMTEFEKRESGEYTLEEDRDSNGGSYRWASLDTRRLCTGFVNPPTVEDADEHNLKVLDMAQYHLDLSSLQTDALDVLYYFDFLYQGNHDEVVAEALTVGGPLEGLTGIPGGRVLHFQPTVMIAVDEACQLQARLSIETRTSAYQVRTGNYPEAPISVYFTVRQFWAKSQYKSFAESYRNQRRLLDDLVGQYVIPNVLTPLAKAIGAKQ